MLTEVDGIIRLLAAVILGLSIGFSRRGKPAGIRTFALIALGATMFTLASFELQNPLIPGLADLHIIAQIVAGVGFLGLGVIWKSSSVGKPSGLTTAAAIWLTAAVGVLVGLGMWAYAITSVVLTILVLFSKKPLVKARMDE